MAILLPGGAGYIGSHTAVELLNAGKEIIIIDNFSNSKPEVLDKIKKITGKDFKFYELNYLDRKNLEKVLKRAQRWGAVMLIDEADVYIRRRGNEIDHNAVVASFLRTLEYFHGLLFLTTNRVDDVDDAIASRCIATIRYSVPKAEDAKRIWNVLANQFQFQLPEDLVDSLVDNFRGVSGRDIKELLKLTAKWCRQKNLTPSLDVFKTCAQFRGL